MYKQKTCVFHRLAKSFCQFCWRGRWLWRARNRSRVKVISYPPIVLKVWVITKMLSMPIPRRRKGITAKGTHYRFHLCLGVCLLVPVCFVFCPCFRTTFRYRLCFFCLCCWRTCMRSWIEKSAHWTETITQNHSHGHTASGKCSLLPWKMFLLIFCYI